MDKVNILVDFFWQCSRAKHAHRNKIVHVNGVPYNVGVLDGLYQEYIDMELMYPNVEIFLCYDGKPTKSLSVNPDYKGDRNYSIDERALQLSRKEMSYALTNEFSNVTHSYNEDLEADEVIAFLCDTLPVNEYKIIYSTDGDLRQKVDSTRNIFSCKQFNVSTGNAKSLEIEDENYLCRFGPVDLRDLYPYAIAMYKAIKGDSDNITGIYRFSTELAKKVALKYPTPDLLESYLKKLEEHNRLTKIDKILSDNLSTIKVNYYQTYLDPQQIPKFVKQFDFNHTDYLNKYLIRK